MGQHSSNENSEYIGVNLLEYLASHAQHTEQCLYMLKQYLPLCKIDPRTIEQLEEMATISIENNLKTIQLIENVKKRNTEQKPN